MSRFDLAVIGLGAMGAATAHRAAAAGARVLGLDRHAPPHDQGSSHGESRITRQAIGEGLEYVPLALRAHELWREIENQTGEALFSQVGALMIARPGLGAAHHGVPGFFERTLKAARTFDIAHEVLSAAEARRRWPKFHVGEDESAYFEPGAGLVRPEACIAAQLRLAAASGADLRTGETVRGIESVDGRVWVTTDRGVHEAGQAVVCAGAWTPALIGGPWARNLTLYRQVMHWFGPEAAGSLERGPVFIWMYGEGDGDWFYGFPEDPALGGVKIASEQWSETAAAPEAIERSVAAEEALAAHARHIAGRIEGLPPRWLRSKACIYTCAPQSRFMIGADPERPGVIVVSACSGHGFKHSPAIGEAVAQWALSGLRPAVLAPFEPTTT